MLCEDYASDSDSDSGSDNNSGNSVTNATVTGAVTPEQQPQRRESSPVPEGTAPPLKRACVDTQPPSTTTSQSTPQGRMVPPQVWKRRPNTTAVDF